MARNINQEHKESLSRHERLMLWIAGIVGSTAFVIFCVLLTFTPLVFPSTLNIVQFVSSGFLQLVLLPIILIAGNLQGRHSELRAEAEYEATLKTEKDTEDILKRLEKLEKHGST